VSLDPKHVPKQIRGAYVLAVLSASILAAAGVAYGMVRQVASRVVDEKWDGALEAKVTAIATSAAVQGARAAAEQVTREQIGPLSAKVAIVQSQLDQHVPKDDALGQKLEAVVAQCCPVIPHAYYPPPRWR
jgi:hypothetical protein